MKKSVFLLLGTNLGERSTNLTDALTAIDQHVGTITKRSSVYETSPWGKTDQPNFLNQAVQVESSLDAGAVLKRLLAIEERLGRQRNEKWGQRLIDIDILFFADEIIESPGLVIPHPQLHNRRFTLMPMYEIAPEWVHPVFKKNMRELLEACPDTLSVTKFFEAV